MRELNCNAGPVARLRITATRAAMGEIDKDLNALCDNLVGFLTIKVCDEADATGIVLVPLLWDLGG